MRSDRVLTFVLILVFAALLSLIVMVGLNYPPVTDATPAPTITVPTPDNYVICVNSAVAQHPDMDYTRITQLCYKQWN